MKQINNYDAKQRVSSMELEYMRRVQRWLTRQKIALVSIVHTDAEDNPNDDIDLYTVRGITANGVGQINDYLIRASCVGDHCEILKTNYIGC